MHCCALWANSNKIELAYAGTIELLNEQQCTLCRPAAVLAMAQRCGIQSYSQYLTPFCFLHGKYSAISVLPC